MSHIIEEPIIGDFEIKSGKVVVTDPCYEIGTWCQGTLDNVMKGKWHLYLGRSYEGAGGFGGVRVAELTVIHDQYSRKYERDKWDMGEKAFQTSEAEMLKYFEDLKTKGDPNVDLVDLDRRILSSKLRIEQYSPLAWEKSEIDVGVDSGQAGVFDLDIYPKSEEERGDYGQKETFYGKCCDKTLHFPNGGVIEGGALSSSGFGDGGYDCFVAKKHGQIVGIKIVYIRDPGLDDESDIEDEEADDDNTNE